MKPKNKAIFLDRDGVLNKAIIKNGKPYPPATVAELQLTEGVQAALIKLKNAGFLLIGATNQPDVARGTTTIENVAAINTLLCKQLNLDDIRVCYHDDVEQCQCRKPKPGLLTQAALDYGIDLKQSFMIGDRWRDIDAGRNASCRTVWIKTGYDEKRPANMDYTAVNLLDAAEWICGIKEIY